MSTTPPSSRYTSFTIREAVVGFIALLMLTLAACDLSPRISDRSHITRSIYNARQMITAIKIYSSDHGGIYPDGHASVIEPKTANQALRLLFPEGVLDNELIAGSSLSKFIPDGNIGVAPDFAEALKPGENHWAMTAGLTDNHPGNIPLLFENPSVASWPPKWDADAKLTSTKGRTWSASTVIIGMNDSNVTARKLAATSGKAVPLKPQPSGKDIFEEAIHPTTFPVGRVLDIEE